MDKLKMHTLNKLQEHIAQIAALFPNAVTETIQDGKVVRAIDFDVLRQELSDGIVEGPAERYQFTWPDKKKSILQANAPINKTLRPCREESVDFDTTENLYIEGDNLEALKLLQETYLGQVKLIYIDPPYNTGNDFVYADDFAQSSEDYKPRSGEFDTEGGRLVANPESNGRFHTDWLNMIFPRLKLAKDLLAEDGVIFISIDDNEVDNLLKICNEIFGEENFIGVFVINSSPSAIDYGHIAKMHDYVVFFAKNSSETNTNQLPEKNKLFKYTDTVGPFNIYPLYNGNVSFNPGNRPNLFYPFYLNPINQIEEGFYEIGLEEREGWIKVIPVISKKDGIQRIWRWGKDKSRKYLNKDIIGYKTEAGEYRVIQKSRHTGKVIRSLQTDQDVSTRRGTAEVENIFGSKFFSFPKPVELIKKFITISVEEDDIILDFFAGSSTTAHAVMQLNAENGGKRKFVMVQLPESTDENSEAYKSGYKNICEIGKERIRRAGKKIKDEAGLMGQNLDIGFRVLKVDSSNLQDVYYTPAETKQMQMAQLADNIKPERSAEDLLFQVMLDLGVLLSSKIEALSLGGKTVYSVADGYLLACFDKEVSEETITEIARRQPYYAVLRDSSIADDSVAANFEQIFATYSPTTVRKVL